MCKKCEELLSKFTPDEQEFIVWNLTAYPMGGHDQIAAQIQHVIDVGIAAAQKEFDEYMEKFWKERANDHHRN